VGKTQHYLATLLARSSLRKLQLVVEKATRRMQPFNLQLLLKNAEFYLEKEEPTSKNEKINTLDMLLCFEY